MALLANAQRSRAADAVTARCNSGVLRIYSGTVPADANAALSGNTLLAELTFGATAFAASVNGVATANAITGDTSNDATGTPSFFRAFETGGSVVVYQGTAGGPSVAINTSASTAANGNVLTFAATTGVVVGMSVTGAGIPAGAVVVAVTGTTVTLDRVSTAGVASGASITFSFECALSGLTGGQIIAGGTTNISSLTYTQADRS